MDDRRSHSWDATGRAPLTDERNEILGRTSWVTWRIGKLEKGTAAVEQSGSNDFVCRRCVARAAVLCDESDVMRARTPAEHPVALLTAALTVCDAVGNVHGIERSAGENRAAATTRILRMRVRLGDHHVSEIKRFRRAHRREQARQVVDKHIRIIVHQHHPVVRAASMSMRGAP